jgi:hypothetical protein
MRNPVSLLRGRVFYRGVEHSILRTKWVTLLNFLILRIQ